jgi:hypothetical protein
MSFNGKNFEKITLIIILGLFQLSHPVEKNPLERLSITLLFQVTTAFLSQNLASADMVTHLTELSPHLIQTPFYRTAENMISALINVFEGHLTIIQAEQAIHQEVVSAYMTLYNL